MAAHLSRQEASRAAAKNRIIQAIEAISYSLSITSEGLEDTEEELGVLARIAARVGVQGGDLDFLQQMNPEILPFLKRCFSDMHLMSLASVERFNESVEARKKDDREQAAILLKRALDLAIEQTEEDRAFKAFLAYQHGVNLLKAHNLEDYRVGRQLSPVRAKAADEIRNAWKECIRLYHTISESHLSDFSKRYANLTEAVRNIKQDTLMSGYL